VQRYKGEIEMPFDGKMTLMVKDGGSFSFPVQGEYNKFSMTHLVARCVPPGAPRPIPVVSGREGESNIGPNTKVVQAQERVVGEVKISYKDDPKKDSKKGNEERSYKIPLYMAA
jgi:hypothetical protein